MFTNDEIEISFFRSSGPGGQKKNVTDSAVRVKHLPTGLIAVSSASRSQHRNKAAALETLARRLAERRRRPKPRVSTRPSRAARQRRLDAKHRRGQTKRMRGRPVDD